MRATRKLQLLVAGTITLIPSFVLAQAGGGTGGGGGTSDHEEHVTGIINMVSAAVGGNTTAQKDLVAMAAMATFFVALLFISYIIASAIGRFIGGMVTKKVDVTLGKFVTKAIRNLIMLVVAMVALDKCGANVTGLAAILAAAGFAVGMALQGTLQNFAAGIMLLLFRPFKVDDYIVVAGTEGTVEEIDLFTTRLNALDNRHLIIPNGEIFGAKLENFSRNALRRVDVGVGAGYIAKIEDTRTALQFAVDSVNAAFVKADGEINVPAPQVYLMELGASSVDWQLRVWARPENYWAVREELTAAAKRALDSANISIPYPQMDVHVVGQVLAKSAAA